MKFLLMMPLVALSIAAAANGPCACSLGKLCSWSGTDYSGSHEEYTIGDPGEGTVSRSLLNKTLLPVVVSGTVRGKAASFCLDPGLGNEDTGEFVLAQVKESSTPCP